MARSLTKTQQRALETIAACGDVSTDSRRRKGLSLNERTLRVLAERCLIESDWTPRGVTAWQLTKRGWAEMGEM
jgi:hypothetical protein